jgi:methylmalonyl-CoA mutase N-terminal domain/subunit
MLRFHAQTAGCSLTAQQPENNVVRTTLQALAAVMGGCQSLHTNSLDEALALPSERAARIALRTQQIIAHESGVASVVDPMGGSFFLEALTDEVEREANALIDQVDEMGGALRALDVGFFQRAIAESAFTYQTQVESGDAVIVGVNRFVSDESTPVDVLQVDPTIAAQQIERVRDLRRRRDIEAVSASLEWLREGARGSDNLVPRIVHCVERECTLGEISDALREVFGVHREVVDV